MVFFFFLFFDGFLKYNELNKITSTVTRALITWPPLGYSGKGDCIIEGQPTNLQELGCDAASLSVWTKISECFQHCVESLA